MSAAEKAEFAVGLAQHGDIPALVRMARQFTGQLTMGVEMDEESMITTFMNLMDAEDGELFVVRSGGKVTGMAAVALYPSMVNRNVKIGQELFWWIDESARGGVENFALMDEVEAWCEAMGADRIVFAASEPLKTRALGRLYERRGYRRAEIHFVRELN